MQVFWELRTLSEQQMSLEFEEEEVVEEEVVVVEEEEEEGREAEV